MTVQSRDTLQRKRAAFAYDKIRTCQNKEWESRILVLIKKLPMALRTQGLSLTMATLMSKDLEGRSKDQNKSSMERRELAGFLASWILTDAPQKPFQKQQSSEGTDSPMELLECCIRADRASYLAAQYEALMLIEELKVIAQALLKA